MDGGAREHSSLGVLGGCLLLGVSCVCRTGFFSKHGSRWKESHPGPQLENQGRADRVRNMRSEHSVMRWGLPDEDPQRMG